MKLASFQVQTPVGRFTRIGSVQPEDTVLDLSSAYAALKAREGEPHPYRLANALVPPDMKRFIEGGKTALQEAQRAVNYVLEEGAKVGRESGRRPEGPQGECLVFAMSDVILLPPLPHPNSLRDFILFEGHFRRAYDVMGVEPPEAWYKMPIYYKGNAAAIIGHGQDLIWPAYTEKLDYELELALIIGKEGRNIKSADAGEYIFGFSCFNDFSARDIQSEEMSARLGPAKGKDFATAIGPWIATKDEAGDYHNLDMVARVNGEVWSTGNCRDMYHTWERMIEHVSMEETVYPTDVSRLGDCLPRLRPGDRPLAPTRRCHRDRSPEHRGAA